MVGASGALGADMFRLRPEFLMSVRAVERTLCFPCLDGVFAESLRSLAGVSDKLVGSFPYKSPRAFRPRPERPYAVALPPAIVR